MLCLAEQILFSQRCEFAIEAGTLSEFQIEMEDQLSKYTNVDLASLGLDKSQMKVVELKLKALTLDTIHSIDVLHQLVKAKVKSKAEWTWQKQLRFYLEGGEDCVIRMVDASFEYTYEYQGNAPKLVHTPLTDKCYLTLTQGMLSVS